MTWFPPNAKKSTKDIIREGCIRKRGPGLGLKNREKANGERSVRKWSKHTENPKNKGVTLSSLPEGEMGKERWALSVRATVYQQDAVLWNHLVSTWKNTFTKHINGDTAELIPGIICSLEASQVVLVVKNPTINAGDSDEGSIPRLGRSTGGRNGNQLQYSCLGNPVDRGTWQATVHRVTMSWT